MARLTKTQRLARERLLHDLIHLSRDDWVSGHTGRCRARCRHTLEVDVDVEEPREKVTLYLDRSVARFYRGMGHGYQARINRLLRTWAQMKIAGEVRVDEFLAKRVAGDKGETAEDGEAG